MDLVSQMRTTLGPDIFDRLVDQFTRGNLTLAELGQYPLSELDNVHRAGKKLISQKRYQEAADVLHMLVTLHSVEAEYWLSYGIALQNLGEHETALLAYTVVQERLPARMQPYIYAAECELMLQRPQFALRALEPVFHLETTTPHEVASLKRAQRIKAIAEGMKSGAEDLPNLEQLDDLDDNDV